MTTCIGVPRGSLPQEKRLRRDRRNHSETKRAKLIGKIISDELRSMIIGSRRKLKESLEAVLRNEGFNNLKIKVKAGEVHAYITGEKRRCKGHVIVPIPEASGRYHRGYNMPHGQWNHSN